MKRSTRKLLKEGKTLIIEDDFDSCSVKGCWIEIVVTSEKDWNKWKSLIMPSLTKDHTIWFTDSRVLNIPIDLGKTKCK